MTAAVNVSQETDRNMVISLKELCIAVADSIGSTVNKKAESNEKKDSTRLPGLVRRIGRWIMNR